MEGVQQEITVNELQGIDDILIDGVPLEDAITARRVKTRQLGVDGAPMISDNGLIARAAGINQLWPATEASEIMRVHAPDDNQSLCFKDQSIHKDRCPKACLPEVYKLFGLVTVMVHGAEVSEDFIS